MNQNSSLTLYGQVLIHDDIKCNDLIQLGYTNEQIARLLEQTHGNYAIQYVIDNTALLLDEPNPLSHAEIVELAVSDLALFRNKALTKRALQCFKEIGFSDPQAIRIAKNLEILCRLNRVSIILGSLRVKGFTLQQMTELASCHDGYKVIETINNEFQALSALGLVHHDMVCMGLQHYGIKYFVAMLAVSEQLRAFSFTSMQLAELANSILFFTQGKDREAKIANLKWGLEMAKFLGFTANEIITIKQSQQLGRIAEVCRLYQPLQALGLTHQHILKLASDRDGTGKMIKMLQMSILLRCCVFTPDQIIQIAPALNLQTRSINEVYQAFIELSTKFHPDLIAKILKDAGDLDVIVLLNQTTNALNGFHGVTVEQITAILVQRDGMQNLITLLNHYLFLAQHGFSHEWIVFAFMSRQGAQIITNNIQQCMVFHVDPLDRIEPTPSDFSEVASILAMNDFGTEAQEHVFGNKQPRSSSAFSCVGLQSEGIFAPIPNDRKRRKRAPTGCTTGTMIDKSSPNGVANSGF